MSGRFRIPGGPLLTALLVSGCQAAAPDPIPAPPPIPPEVFARFEFAPATGNTALEPVHVLGASTRADEEGVDAPAAALELGDVLLSVERHFPLVLAALEEVEIAEGRLQEARGGFDTRLLSRGEAELEGFYGSERLDVSVVQPTPLWGATFSGGYRLGTGDFAVYDGKAKTNGGGEFRVGMSLPLLQDRAIDPRRVKVWEARLEREQADPKILEKRLAATRRATDAYWKWVAAGRVREIALRVLALAEDRTDQLELAVREGLLAPITLTENQRLIVSRRNSLLRAERGLQEAAIALSLYWRDADGQPRVPAEAALPYEFPTPRPADEVLLPGDEDLALAQRPELRAARLELQAKELERSLARNAWLPQLDLGVIASQDVGDAVGFPDDKGPFEFGALLSLEVPLQRRDATGRQRRLSAEIARQGREVQYLGDVIVAEVRDARSSLMQSWLRIEQASENVRLANELADAERLQLAAGESDLLRVNLREEQAALAASALVDVLREYFRSLTAYRAVLGVPFEGTPGVGS